MDKTTMKWLLGAAAISLSATLAGCGGGGGGTPQVATVSGTVAKGLVRQARVLVCRIVDGVPEPDSSCIATTTGNDGSYRAVFNSTYRGPAMVKVMTATGSSMMDEFTGQDVPYAMTMRAVVPAITSTTTVHVTPFSEMAARAASMTTMTAGTITQSIAAVQTAMAALGIDLGVMPMMDILHFGNDATILAMQANMTKQLARVAMAAHRSTLLTDAAGVPCNAAGTTPSAQMACAVAAMADAMTSYSTQDPVKMAAVLAALQGQDPTAVTVPIMRTDGAIQTATIDMISTNAMQTTLQTAGIPIATASGMMTTIMSGMR